MFQFNVGQTATDVIRKPDQIPKQANPAVPPPTTLPQPPEPVTAHYFTGIEEPGFVYPEASNTKFGIPALKAKPSFGVAISGGGFRASTCAYGWLRGLQQIGALGRARYLASNSGGSWCNGAYSYRQQEYTDSAFFDPYVKPEDLTPEYINGAPKAGTYAATIANGTPVQDMLRGKVVETRAGLRKWLHNKLGWDILKPSAIDAEPWSMAIASTFLKPYGCGDLYSTVSCAGTSGNVADSVRARTKDMPVYLATPTDDRPYPIIVGSVYCPPGDAFKFYPVEFTPLYTGLPASDHETLPIKLGAFFLEPLAFGSQPPKQGTKLPSSKDGSKEVTVHVNHTIPLALAVGISSSFLAVGVTLARALLNPRLQDLGSTELLSLWSPADEQSAVLPFADGGAQDNLAVFPLLRREVRKVVVCVAASKPFSRSLSSSMCANDNSDLAGLFGAVPTGITDEKGIVQKVDGVNGVEVAVYNKQAQVFDRNKWEELYEHMADAVDSGKPATFKQTYKVLRNKFQNVHPYEVEVLWVLNQRCDDWEVQLPQATRAKLAAERPVPFRRKDLIAEVANAAFDKLEIKTLENHPLYSTFSLDWANAPVQMLANQATWTIVAAPGVAQQIRDMAEL